MLRERVERIAEKYADLVEKNLMSLYKKDLYLQRSLKKSKMESEC